MDTRRTALLVLLLSGVATACQGGGVSRPLPDPPNLTPETIEVVSTFVGGPIVTGAPGTVTPPEGELVFTHLDGPEPPTRVNVQPDGSFDTVVLEGEGLGEYRLEVRTPETRSAPIDVIVSNGTFAQVVRPLEACLGLVPGLALDLGEIGTSDIKRGTVLFENDCAEDVQVGSFDTRTGDPSVDLDTPLPTTVPAGDNVSFEVRYAPANAGDLEEILFLQITAPEMTRRPISVFGGAR